VFANYYASGSALPLPSIFAAKDQASAAKKWAAGTGASSPESSGGGAKSRSTSQRQSAIDSVWADFES
jgi:hypothetical protein